MYKIFIPAYRFLKKHKALMWTILVATSVVFTFFAFQLKYKENIIDLLPKTEKAEASGVAFSQLSVKDRVFVQFVAKDGAEVSTEELAEACDAFVDLMMEKDTATGYVTNVLYKVQDEWLLNAMDYGLTSFPAYLEESAYADFDRLLSRDVLVETMQDNLMKIAEDYTGSVTTMICYDPAGLRYSMKNQLGGAADGVDLSEGVQFGTYMFKDRHLFSPDGTVALAYVSLGVNSFDSNESLKVEKMLARTRKEIEASHEGVEVLYHGAPIRSAGNSHRIKMDLLVTMLISVFVILLVLLYFFRSFKEVLKVLFPILYGMVFAMACVYWIKGEMSLMAMGIGAVVLGIAVSYVLHVLLHSKYVRDVETLLHDQSTPVCMSCLTTIGAFAGLLFTNSALLQDFGIFACFMIVGSTLAALIFLPQFLASDVNPKSEKAMKLLEKINAYPLDRKYVFAGLLAAVVVLGCVFSGKVGFDKDLQNVNYLSKRTARSEQMYCEKVNAGEAAVFYGASGASFDEALRNSVRVVDVLDSLRADSVVVSCSSLAKMIPDEARQQANIDRWKAYWTPERIARVRKDIAYAARKAGLSPDMFETFFTIVESDYDPSSAFDSGAVPAELASNIGENVDGEYLVFASALMEPSNKRTVGDVVTEQPSGLVMDPFYYASDMVEIVHQDYSKVLYISSIFVLIVLLLTFRNLLVALLAFMPMFLSWFVVEGLMAIFGIEFNILNIVISSFVFGVGVDYSIFIMDGLLAEHRGKGSELMVYHKGAISLSALFLVVVVASLLLAKSPAIYSVGVITLIGMVSTILLAYCLMPLAFRLCMKVPFFSKICR